MSSAVMKNTKSTVMPVQSKFSFPHDISEPGLDFYKDYKRQKIVRDTNDISTYYYKHPANDKFLCCYNSLWNTLAQTHYQFTIPPFNQKTVIAVPYDKIRFSPDYSHFSLEQHLEHARGTGHFVIIDKSVEHLHNDADFMHLYNNLKTFDLLDRCVVLDNTKDETLFGMYNVPHIYIPGYPLFYIALTKKIPQYVAEPKYAFLCLNNYNKPHRLATIAMLSKNNMLRKTAWSYREKATTQNQTYNPNQIIPDWDEKMINFETPKHLDQGAEDFDQDANMSTLYGSAKTSIATETDYIFDKTSFATEKCYNAIHYGAQLIAVSCAGTIDIMREHGIDVYDDIVDHSYDAIKDPIERFKAIQVAIEDNYSIGGYKQVRTALAPRILRNQMLLTHYDHWYKELEHCIDTAHKNSRWEC